MNGVESIKTYYTEESNARAELHKKRGLQLKKKMTKVKKPKVEKPNDIPDERRKMFKMLLLREIFHRDE